MAIRYRERQHLFTLLPIKGITVRCYETGTDNRGATTYVIDVRHHGRDVFGGNAGGEALTGAFAPSWTSDGKQARRGVLSHVAMKPGDTDREFFKDYTPEQIEFVERYGEELSLVAMDRYGEE